MATISLTFSAAALTRIANAIGYSATLPNGQANPVLPVDALKAYITNLIVANVEAFEAPTVASAAIAANNINVVSVIQIT